MIPCLFSPINSSKSPSVLQRSLLLASNFDFLPSSPMDSLALLKFWKSSTAKVAGCGDPVPADECPPSPVDEEDDSFFELELALPDCSDLKEEKSDRKIGRIGDFISIETPDARINSNKPQSPISILRESAPNFRVFMLGKLIRKSKPEKGKPHSISEPKAEVNFSVKLRMEDNAGLKKKFRRSESSKSNTDVGDRRELDGASSRFSKDSVHKYLSLIKKPRFAKLSSTRSSDEPSDFASTAAFFASPRKSEDRARFKAPGNYLGKSRSAGPMLVGAMSPAPAVWKDDSLAQQNDGIQGAILHCKQSFNSPPTELRVMSRCGSDTSHDKAKQRSGGAE